MKLGRQAIPPTGVKFIYPHQAVEVVEGEEVYLGWMEGAEEHGDVFIVGDEADLTALLTIGSSEQNIQVGVLAGSNDMQGQCSVVSTENITPATLTDAFITSFSVDIGETTYDGVIKGTDITLYLPLGTDVSDLTPAVTISNRATSDPADPEVSTDFSTPETYTITAEDGTTENEYTVSVVFGANPSEDAFITSFKIVISEVDYVGEIGSDDTIAVTVPALTDPSALTDEIVYSNGATISPAVGEKDYTNPVVFTVTAEDGVAETEYTVTVTVDS